MFHNILPQVVLLESETEAAIIVDAAATLGSFGYGDDTQQQLVAEGPVVSALRRGLDNPAVRVVEACARSLKIIYRTNIPRPEV